MRTQVNLEREETRIEAIKSIDVLDTPAEKQYDNLTKLAAAICDVPIAMINLIDRNRQWVKSKVGTEFQEGSRENSFCSFAIANSQKIIEIQDVRKDPRFINNPFVKNKSVVFYAGYVLEDEEGHALGTLCLLDFKPKTLNEHQRNALFTLGNQIEALFELRLKTKKLLHSRNELQQHNNLLKNFAGAVSHDLKMPLASIIMSIDVLKNKYFKDLGEEALAYMDRLKQSSLGMSEYISHILDYYETENVSSEDFSEEPFGLKGFLESIVDMLNIDGNCEINFPDDNFDLICNRSGLEQIFLNLLGNSLKYNDKEKTVINIEAKETPNYYWFQISDNGMGIPSDELENIFNLFSIATDRDRHGRKGNGIGLSTVKKLVDKLGGNIHVESEVGKFTRFSFTIKKPKMKKQAAV